MDDADPPHEAGALVGRAGDAELVLSLVDRTADRGGALLVVGEPGVGKSVLLDVAARGAAASGMRVLTARGERVEAAVGFAGLHRLLMPVLGDLTSLSDLHREALATSLGVRAAPPADRLIVSTAALMLVRQVAGDAPVVMIVDDVQWLDRASAGVLGFIARRLSGARITFLAAARSGTDEPVPLSGMPEHEVHPLEDGPADELLRHHYPSLAPRVHRRILAAAQGNPLALLELPAVLTDLQRSGLQGLPSVLPLSRGLRMLFASRIRDLPSRTRHLLLLTVLGGNGDFRFLRAVSRDQDWLDVLAPAEAGRLVRVDTEARRVALRHPLIGSAAVELATSSERRRAHNALAEALGAQPERRAWHLAEAAVGLDGRAADLLDQAARGALRAGDSVRAVTALLRAADLSSSGRERARRLAEAAYVGADVSGDLRNVPHLLRQARTADPSGDGSLEAAVAAAHHLLNGDGDIDRAHRALVRAIDAAVLSDVRGGPLDEALHNLLVVCHVSGRPEPWTALERAVARSEGRAGPVVSVSRWTYGAPARVTASIAERLDGVIAGVGTETDPTRVVRIGIAAFYLDRLGECRQALWSVVQDGRDGGAVASAVNALMMLCHDAFAAGRWDEARRAAEEGIGLGESLGYRLISLPGVYCLALLAAVEGDGEKALGLAREIDAWAAPRGARGIEHFASRVRALSALAAGDAEEAYRQAASISPPGVFAAHVPVALWACMDLVDAAVRTGRREAAVAHVAAMQDLEIFGLRPRLALLAAGSAALVAPGASAAAEFERALAVPGGDHYPFEHARVRLAYGEHLRRSRATGAARLQLAAARSTFSRLGARPWAERAEHELRATGVTRATDHPGDMVVLTPQEYEVALLAASGLTNKQIGAQLFISPRTVGAHLYRLFPRLGITSRAALRDALTRGPLTVGDHGPG